MDNQEWRDVVGYEGLYRVSNCGRVWTKLRERELSQSICNGYRRVGLRKDGTSKLHFVHRLVAIAFLGQSDLQVNHINGLKWDNRIENLEWVSAADNMKHAVENGLNKYIYDNGVLKLNPLAGTYNPFKKAGYNNGFDIRDDDAPPDDYNPFEH